MIYVEKDIASQIIVTFYEKTTLSSPVYYLIQVTNTDQEVVESFTPTEESTTTERYNQFTITSALAEGEYHYAAYESNTLNPTLAQCEDTPVEYGIFVVNADEEIEDSVYR